MEKFNFIINGNNYDTEVLEIIDNKAQIQVNGVIYNVEIDRTIRSGHGSAFRCASCRRLQ